MRLATYADLPAISEAASRLAVYATKYEWVGGVDYQEAMTNLMTCVDNGNTYLVNGYAVFVEEVTPWWAPVEAKVLKEWLVMRVSEPSPEGVNALPKALTEIAKSRGCVGVLGGDSSPVSIVAGAYEQAGWLALTKAFYQEVL